MKTIPQAPVRVLATTVAMVLVGGCEARPDAEFASTDDLRDDEIEFVGEDAVDASTAYSKDPELLDEALDLDELNITLTDEGWEFLGKVPQLAPTEDDLIDAAEVARSGTSAELFNDKYEAMLVLSDGTAYGRVGPAPEAPLTPFE